MQYGWNGVNRPGYPLPWQKRLPDDRPCFDTNDLNVPPDQHPFDTDEVMEKWYDEHPTHKRETARERVVRSRREELAKLLYTPRFSRYDARDGCADKDVQKALVRVREILALIVPDTDEAKQKR